MKWVKLVVAANELEADIICSLLENESIPTERRHKGINLKVIMGLAVETEILVPEDKKEEAQQILSAFSSQEIGGVIL
ncbi:MAG: hypothetical protein XD78_0455 [Desulfotomaculum sp. 46_296]|nr:MAG: hypothetical protein XD78_0455 [Desulfotomaculum sp. 46_296]HAU31398.1 hypothetical protein [Desulfotomaculum sp.]